MHKLKSFINKETILYIIFGVLTTVVDFLISGICFYILGFKEIFSNNTGWVFAVLFAFITNKVFVFNSMDFSVNVLKKEFPSFVIARVASLILTDLFLIAAKIIGMEFMLAKLLISVIVILMNYIFSKLFIFTSHKKENENDE